MSKILKYINISNSIVTIKKNFLALLKVTKKKKN